MNKASKHKRRLIIVSAPSGAGKSTICKVILEKFSDLRLSVSYTTRKPRHNEVHGSDYFFVDEKTFNRMREDGKFAESAQVHGSWYATSKEFIKGIQDEGNDVLLEIDVQGAMNLKRLYPDSITIFVAPPSLKELEARLRGRNSETEESIKKRLENAKKELESKDFYEYIVVNKNLEEAIKETIDIINKRR